MGSLSVIDTATNTVVATVPIGVTPLSVATSPDGTRVVVTDQFNTVYVIDAATNTVLTTVNVNSQALGAAYTSDGSRLYVSGTNGADIIDPATNTVVGTVPAPGLGAGNVGTSFIGPNIIEAAGGPLSVASDAALTPLGFGQFVNFNGGTLQAAASFGTARTISLLAGGGTIDTNGFNVTMSGQIINTGGLTKAGLGTLVLSGANTYTGGTTSNAGTVSVSADNNLGDASGGLTFNGGTLQTTSTFVSNRAVTLNAAGGTFNIDTSTGLGLNGVISGPGGLTKTGGGILLLGGINTYTGGTTINGGSLQLGSDLVTASIVGTVTNECRPGRRQRRSVGRDLDHQQPGGGLLRHGARPAASCSPPTQARRPLSDRAARPATPPCVTNGGSLVYPGDRHGRQRHPGHQCRRHGSTSRSSRRPA